jgi:methylenetetrahydrofolate reductase (NADPH)
MATMNGSVIPAPLLARLDAAASPDEVVAIGIEAASEICATLLAAEMPGLHLYPMNRSESIRRIFANLGLLP